MKRDLSICMLLCIAGCRFESRGLGETQADQSAIGGATTSTFQLSGGATNNGTSTSPRGGTTFMSSTASGGLINTTAEGGAVDPNPATGGTLASYGGTSATSEPIQTGGSSNTEQTTTETEPTCETLDIETTRTRIGPRSSYASSFEIDCPFKQATLEVLFDGTRGPNLETPPIISISNDLHTQSFNVASFMPALSNDVCWTVKEDGSHDYSCAFSVIANLSGILIAGNNTMYIVGKQGDTFTVSSIRITF